MCSDTLWYPGWNRSYIRSAADAVAAAIMLKRRTIAIDFDVGAMWDLKHSIAESRQSRSPCRVPGHHSRSTSPNRGKIMSSRSSSRVSKKDAGSDDDGSLYDDFDSTLELKASRSSPNEEGKVFDKGR